MGCKTRGDGDCWCVVCGARLGKSRESHRCPPGVEARRNREAVRDVDLPPDPADLDQRLADGFAMLEGEPSSDRRE